MRTKSLSERAGWPLLLLVAVVIAGVGSAAASAAPATAATAKAPAKDAAAPILDRELFFGDPEISQGQISPDGQFISFVKPFKGTRNVWVKGTTEPFEAARPLTADTRRPIPTYFWSRDSHFILFVQDKDGDENYNIYAVNPKDKPAEGADVPVARNLTDLKGVRAAIYAVPRNMPDTIYVGLNDRDASWHDLYKVSLSTGERTLIRSNTEKIAEWFFDNKGNLKMAQRTADNGDTEILRVDEKGFTKVYGCNVFESCGLLRYTKDEKRIYMSTNKGDAIDLERLVLFDPATGKDELVESDPLKRVDFGGPIFSEVTDELVGTTYEDEKSRHYWRDKAVQADYEYLQKKLPGKDIFIGSTTADETVWFIAAGSDTEPGERHLFDRKTKKLTFQYRVRERLPRESLASMKPVKYPSSDGLMIPAFLTLPKGVAAKGLPAVIVPHGGPWARDSWGYNGFSQFLANRGYAVLQPNFRGSTGYGKKFLNAANNEWGQKMQDDLTWGVKYLVAQGIADPKKVGIMGGSYGGYATLAGVAFTPDVYAAAVSIVGPSNLITLLDSIPPYWESIRKIFLTRMGDPATSEGKAQLARQSPLNSADKIKTPLLVVQGANDPRVKRAESDQIVVALRERGFPVEYLVAPDEGHGFQRPVNNMAMFATAEKFFTKHLGGRMQEGMTPEVATRLGEITVDVKTVSVQKKVDVASVGLPKAETGLTAGTRNYQCKLEAGGQTIEMTLAREIKEDGGNWVVTEALKGPMGDVRGEATLEKGTLAVLGRKEQQGPVSIELSLKDNKASGNMTMGDKARPIDVALGGPIFADGAGADDSVAALPLAEGYAATFRTFDLQRQKEKLMQLKVAAVESVTVPAGTFETWRVDLTSADGDAGGSSVWIARDTRKVIKSKAIMAEMGGATMTTELAQ
jgi:dipeptidyl aminopeptidase/acylaminoacyl peptidase